MKTIKVDAYQTTDGKVFYTEKEAKTHQKTLKTKGDLILELSELEAKISKHQDRLKQVKDELDTFNNYTTCPSCNGTKGKSVYSHDCWGKDEYSHFDKCSTCNGDGKVKL